jgi:hypothetical protein
VLVLNCSGGKSKSWTPGNVLGWVWHTCGKCPEHFGRVFHICTPLFLYLFYKQLQYEQACTFYEVTGNNAPTSSTLGNIGQQLIQPPRKQQITCCT